MQKALFFVGNRPSAVWDEDIRGKNSQLLRNFDTRYFEYLADVYSGYIDTEWSQQAAMGLRTSYGFALEALFSLLSSALQAPECVFGWLSLYSNVDIERVFKGIAGSEQLFTRFDGVLTWESLSSLIHRNLILSDKAKEAQIKRLFAQLWEGLASEFLDIRQRSEFNAIKHGLRLQPGGIRLAIGLQDKPGIPASPERMKTIGESKFGGTTFILEKIRKEGLDYRVKESSRNWTPGVLVGKIRIISMSINNIVSFLRIFAGEDATHLEFVWPEDLADFDRVWEQSASLVGSTLCSVMDQTSICETTREEIEQSYMRDASESRRTLG